MLLLNRFASAARLCPLEPCSALPPVLQPDWWFVQEIMPIAKCVVATGGGAVLLRTNWGYMQHGVVIWLDGPPELLAARVVADGVAQRPLVSLLAGGHQNALEQEQQEEAKQVGGCAGAWLRQTPKMASAGAQEFQSSQQLCWAEHIHPCTAVRVTACRYAKTCHAVAGASHGGVAVSCHMASPVGSAPAPAG